MPQVEPGGRGTFQTVWAGRLTQIHGAEGKARWHRQDHSLVEAAEQIWTVPHLICIPLSAQPGKGCWGQDSLLASAATSLHPCGLHPPSGQEAEPSVQLALRMSL